MFCLLVKAFLVNFSKIGEPINMTSEELQAILSKPNNAIVGANRPSGGPQLTSIWYFWDGTSFFFSTTVCSSCYVQKKLLPTKYFTRITLSASSRDAGEYPSRPALVLQQMPFSTAKPSGCAGGIPTSARPQIRVE